MSGFRPALALPGLLPRIERSLFRAGLIALTLASWLYLVLMADAMSSMEGGGGSGALMWLMPMGRWGPAEFALGLVMWAVMMVAMMVPSAAPMLLAFASMSRTGRDRHLARCCAFAAGYLVVWAIFSLVATAAQWILGEAALLTEGMAGASRRLDAVLLLGAGIYQFTPLKYACLRQCRAPLGFLLTEWREGTGGALRMGFRHGWICVGCCWGLMALLFVGGVMNLRWIALLTLAVLIEKALPFGRQLANVAGVAMIACGLWLLAPS